MPRIIAAFLLSPAILPLGFAVAVVVRNGFSEQLIIPAVMSVYTYLVSIALGVPALFLFRHRGWRRLWQFAVGGAVFGIVPVVLARGSVYYIVPYGAIGMVSAAIFWLIGVYGNPWFTNPAATESSR